jgi:hypothetical protein
VTNRVFHCLARLAVAAALLPATGVRAQHFHESRVELEFNRLYDYAEMTQAVRDLVAAYPELLSMESIGKSTGGRDLWLVTLNNPATGADTTKTAMYIDGNIHGNEVQAAEVVLYSIWYLTKSYGEIEKITELVDERAFYFVPMVNPDGREMWFNEASTPNFLRGGIQPTDNDYDGLYDEDGYDDLDGDGHITRMWREDPRGRWKRDEHDDRFFDRVGPDDPPGGWTFVGSEGIDNDGDGAINEDGPGGYDPNRNWPSDWQPNHVQFGAGDYPFSFPETRAIGTFLLAHPNVAAFQSYHNTGGMILRGPATKYISYPGSDVRVFEALQARGVELLPFYRAYVTHEDLYTVHGGEKGWAYEGLGIIGFTNELWTDRWRFYKDERLSAEERRRFRDLLEFGDAYVPYAEFEHPTLGPILVGGTKKWSSRIAPPWVLEEECHRNFAFTMYHADQMPKIAWGNLGVTRTPQGLWEITIDVENDRLTPTILALARQKGIGARDVLRCDARGGTVAASGPVSSWRPDARLEAADTPQPDRIWNAAGIPGQGHRIFRFLVAGTGSVELRYESAKGGTITLDVPLEERAPSAVDGES